MFKVSVASAGRSACLLGMTLIVGLLSGCATLSDTPSGNPHLDGQWHLDKPASDDSDARISAAIAGAETKLRQRLASAGFSQYDTPAGGHGRRGGGAGPGATGSGSADTSSGVGGSTEFNGDEYSQTGYIAPDFGGLQRQLHQLLYSPTLLTITVQSDSVRLAGDGAPVRDYPAGETFTRMDEYGTARISSGWSGTTFELRARYASHATVKERYIADSSAQTLSVTYDLNDPVAGKLTVRSVYRR